jgi:hypothetical protein
MSRAAAVGQVTKRAPTAGRSDLITRFVCFVPFVFFVVTKSPRR